jgi:hypothetical protein
MAIAPSSPHLKLVTFIVNVTLDWPYEAGMELNVKQEGQNL